MNVIAWLEFELAHNDVAVQYISHYTTENPSYFLSKRSFSRELIYKQYCSHDKWGTRVRSNSLHEQDLLTGDHKSLSTYQHDLKDWAQRSTLYCSVKLYLVEKDTESCFFFISNSWILSISHGHLQSSSSSGTRAQEILLSAILMKTKKYKAA